jgi:hypothetical protein
MLQRLGDHIKACRERASECNALAQSHTDEIQKAHYLEMEKHWLHIARSYEFVESLERFLLDRQRNELPHDVEKLPRDNPDGSSNQ